ncbi:MAG: hypothetical protein KDK99_05975 [Verrucomicrobiales bacterium]|nr:hypothetical protein [Verrucomicrobiales bacterium]
MSHHAITFNDLPEGGEKFDTAKGSKLIGAFLVTGLIGLVGSLWKYSTDSDSFAYSWLFAVFLAFTVVVGACFWMLLHSASNSAWGVAIRRIWENMSSVVLVVFLLALPLLTVKKLQAPLWEWMGLERQAIENVEAHGGDVKQALHHMAEANPHVHVLLSKFGYLNLRGWSIRFVIYFAVLWFIGRTLRRKSVAQDQDGDIKHTIKARAFSCIMLFPFALTATFASVDWLMSLDFSWFSTMWGVYIFAGCAWVSMAITILTVTWLRSLGYLNHIVTDEHYHLMGKLLFAFTVFWAYIAFSQYFLIWYANITEETRFFLTRNTESWRSLSIFILFGHFVIPFILLLSQPRKKQTAKMVWICLWIIAMHIVDIYWNVIPERGPSVTHGETWIIPGAWVGDVFALLAVVGIVGYVFLRGLGKSSLYPWRDPRLLESINVVN